MRGQPLQARDLAALRRAGAEHVRVGGGAVLRGVGQRLGQPFVQAVRSRARGVEQLERGAVQLGGAVPGGGELGALGRGDRQAARAQRLAGSDQVLEQMLRLVDREPLHRRGDRRLRAA